MTDTCEICCKRVRHPHTLKEAKEVELGYFWLADNPEGWCARLGGNTYQACCSCALSNLEMALPVSKEDAELVRDR